MANSETAGNQPPEMNPGHPPPLDARRFYILPGHLYKAVLLAVVLFFVLRNFDAIVQTLLLMLAAALLAIALNPLVRAIPLHRKWVVALVGALSLLVLGGLLWLGVPLIVKQVGQFVEQGPELEERLMEWAEYLSEQTGLDFPFVVHEIAHSIKNMHQNLRTATIFGHARGLVEALLLPLVIFMGGLYALASPNKRLLEPMLRVIPTEQRAGWTRILELLGARLFGWIRGRIIAMAAVGILTTVTLYIIGVPFWLALGVLIALVEFIPIFGPWIGGVPAVLIAFLDEPSKGVWTLVAILIIQQIESLIITPWAMSRAARMHPFVTLFSLVLFGSLFGLLGILFALPIVIVLATVVEVLWVERTVGTNRDRIKPVVEE